MMTAPAYRTTPSDHRAWPAVSVIVPAYNAECTIQACVDALLRQHYPADKTEIIVVDNASRDRTGERLAGYGDTISVRREPVRGASAARNAGIRCAHHELIAFTDADCVPHSNWLRALVRHAENNAWAHFVGGKIAAKRPASTIQRFVERMFDQRRAIEVYRPPYVITANALARKSLLFEYGLFNTRFRRGQDVELSFRSGFRHQATFAYCDAAVVDHFNVGSLRGLFHKGLQHGQGSAAIWDAFENELGRSRRRSCFDSAPFRALIGQSLSLLTFEVRRRAGQDDECERLGAFYSALFRCGRQLGFIAGTAAGRLRKIGG